MTTIRPRTKKTKTKSNPATHWLLVLDSSGSMRSIREPARRAFNATLEATQKKAAELGQPFDVTLVIVREDRGTVRFVLKDGSQGRHPLDAFQPLAAGDYWPNGDTPLFRGTWEGIRYLLRTGHEDTSSIDAYLVTVITDGEDTEHTHAKLLADLIREVQATDRWTVSFAVPRGHYKQALCGTLGLPAGNVAEWEQTDEGAERLGGIMGQSMSHYALSRSVGQTKTVDFFQVNANKVKVKDLKSEAVDVTAVTEVFVADRQGEEMADF